MDQADSDIITDIDPDTVYDILELIGKGNYGEVYKAIHRQDGITVAVKKWQVSSDHASLKKEIKILKEWK